MRLSETAASGLSQYRGTGNQAFVAAFAPSEVHVWCCDLADCGGCLDSFESALPPSELRIAERFWSIHHRSLFVMSHGVLRHLLGRYSGVPCEVLQFARSLNGKPFLASSPGGCPIAFSLSHSENICVIALSHASVGIDIEYMRGGVDFERVLGTIAGVRAIKHLAQAPPVDRATLFYRVWTRLEALCKGLDTRLTDRIGEQVLEAAFSRDCRGSTTVIHPDEVWTVENLQLASGYSAAVAIAAKTVHMRYWSSVETVAQLTAQT